MLRCENFEDLRMRDQQAYLVCLVHLVRLMRPNKPDGLSGPNGQDSWRAFSASR